MNILLCGPYFSDEKGTVSKHNAEVGVYDALVELGNEVQIWDHRHNTYGGMGTNGKYDIVLCLGPGFPLKLHNDLRHYGGYRVLWNSEPIRLDCYKNKLLENKDLFDFFFTFDESEIELYNELGIWNVAWLPQGYNPKWYKPIESLTRSSGRLPMCFVGSIGGKWHNREIFLNRIMRRYNIGIEQIFDATKVNAYYNCHKLVLNLGLYYPQSGPPEDFKAFALQQRIFEAVGAGRVVVTNEIPPYTNELFTNKKNILFYNKENLEDVIDYGLANYEELERNVMAIRHQHCYNVRMQRLLHIVLQNLKKH